MADEKDQVEAEVVEGPSASDETEQGQGPGNPKQRFFTLIPVGTNINFVGNRRRYLLFSLFLVLASLGTMLFNGLTSGTPLNFGIDFQGGSQVRVALTENPPTIAELRDALGTFGYDGGSAVEVPDAENEVMIRVKEVVSISDEQEASCKDAIATGLEGVNLLERGWDHPEGSSKIFMKFDAQPRHTDIDRLLDAAGCQGSASAGTGKPDEFPVEYALVGIGPKIVRQINEQFGEGTVDHIVASETVGAKVGGQLKRDGIRAMMIALGLIFLFVMLRFDLRFAPGGIVALAHDAIIVVGCFAISGKEFNLQTLAALLTIIGYSINDTIVVFDRVRERVALHRDDPIEETTNNALNETLSRTVLTSGTTMLVVLATWILGSGPIKDFAFALFIGVIVGTYSSLFVASPVFLWVNHRFYQGRGHLIGADEEEREGTGMLLGGGQTGGTGGDPAGEGEADGDEPEMPTEKKTRRRRRRRPKSD